MEEKLKDIFDNDFITGSDNMWILALFLLVFLNNPYQAGGNNINIYINGEKVGVE